MGGEGGVEVVIVGSFGDGVEGREEKRLRPGSDDAVIMAMKGINASIFTYNGYCIVYKYG